MSPSLIPTNQRNDRKADAEADAGVRGPVSVRGTDTGRRRELLQRYPNLPRRQMEYMAKGEALVRAAVIAALAEDPPWSGVAEGL